MAFNRIKTVFLLGMLTGLLLVVGQLLGGSTGLIIALALSILMNFGSYFFSDKIVLKMYKAREAKISEYPKLHQMIEDIARSAEIPKPRVFIIPTENLNAFATGRSEKHAVVACTQGILKVLSEDELRGVVAHELAHIKNKDMLITTIAATIAGVIAFIASMARWGAIFGGFGRNDDGGGLIELLALAILTPIIALILQLAISRSREYLADKTGAEFINDPNSLADALLKLESGNKTRPLKRGSPTTSSLFIVNPFTKKGLASLFSTHPPLSSRVGRLRKMKF